MRFQSMRVLLLHPEDDFQGPWTGRQWDAVIDLGRAPKSFYEERSAALGCPVWSIFDLAAEVADLQSLRPEMELGLGHVVDRYGIDWWGVISMSIQPELQRTRLAVRLAERLRGCQNLVASRSSLTAEAVRQGLGVRLQLVSGGLRRRLVHGGMRRASALANLSFPQLRQVVFDKYDPHYRWRRKLARSPKPNLCRGAGPVVLLPSAYSNVTKTAVSYARILPRQNFLLVLARESGAISPLPENVASAPLSRFAPGAVDRRELQSLEEKWNRLDRSLAMHPAFQVPAQLRILDKASRYLRWGITIRDAWIRVFDECDIVSCLSADDSNPYTKIPLLLAEQRHIPAVSVHHGALDCFMAFKELRFSNYIAKGEMERDYLERICRVPAERIRVGVASVPDRSDRVWRDDAPWITFFTEPYDTDSWRVEEVYRELLPRLVALARKAGKTVVLKLHPFESLRQRKSLVTRLLGATEAKFVTVMDVPLSKDIMRKTWCAVTVESTVAFDCAALGVPAFLCGWLRHAYSGYAPQYARFGVGRMLTRADELLSIPEMLKEAIPGPEVAEKLIQAMSPEALADVLLGPKSDESRSHIDVPVTSGRTSA